MTSIESSPQLKAILEEKLPWFKVITEDILDATTLWSEKERTFKRISQAHIYFRDIYLGMIKCIHRMSDGKDKWTCVRRTNAYGTENGFFNDIDDAIKFIMN